MSSPLSRILARRNGTPQVESVVESTESVTEHEPAQPVKDPELPPMARMILKQLNLDPAVIVGQVKSTVETITSVVDQVNEKLDQVLRAQVAQMELITVYNDRLALVESKLAMLGKDGEQIVVDESLALCNVCEHPMIMHNEMGCHQINDSGFGCSCTSISGR